MTRGPQRAVLLRRLRHQALGLVFVLLAASFIAGTIGVYTKAFTDVAMVTLRTEFAGNQMREGADVKIRGMHVGEVRAISSTGDGANLELALKPELIEVIPADVTARLLPKTLFGERYVSLRSPDQPSETPLAAGDVISQDRSANAIELERVLDGLMPLLQAVEPQKLSSSLNAIATALDGRGEKLGQTLTRVSRLLGELNPSLPDLKADIASFAKVARTYSDALPDALDAVSNLTTTTRTLAAKRDGLRTLYASVTGASDDLAGFLDANKANLIRLTTTVQPTLDVLARYAPQYPCMMRQFAIQKDAAEIAFGKGAEHPDVSRVKIEITSSRGAYKPGVDEPRYNDDRGPRCYTPVEQPGHWPQYPPDGPIKDGSSKPPPGSTPGEGGNDYEDYQRSGGGGSALGAPVAGTPAETELLSLLLAAERGVEPSAVPGWGGLLVGPLYRGTEVELR
ncbi:MCE family protein [Haloechinothrix halophila]|uniref:MCE family protein n=1 Tax=Haloechinothrix halophila TaxID=1069073 RepID=UPI0004197DD6|nr:MCE family protein [Haloechinothrix halophila]